MREFSQLIESLDATTKTNEKIKALETFVKSAQDTDIVWAVALFTGRRPKRLISSYLLKQVAMQVTGIDEWLFGECYGVVGDLSETVAKLIPPASHKRDMSLTEAILTITSWSKLDDNNKIERISDTLLSLEERERFIFNKLITGGWRLGVSEKLVVKAISNVHSLNGEVLTHRLMGNWNPYHAQLEDFLLEDVTLADDSKPFPFCLAHPIEGSVESLGQVEEWIIEWKWDGIRGQLVKRNSQVFLWSRGEELVTDKFPELAAEAMNLPDGTVLDGEILAWDTINDQPLVFNELQKRIGRKNVSKKILEEVPVVFVAYDLLEQDRLDLRGLPLSKRNSLLNQLLTNVTGKTNLRMSPDLRITTWEEAISLRTQSRFQKAEGFMLKHKNSTYETGRKKGAWWKWKLDPMSIDAVLIYGQQGHGRRANLFTDYTFAVWNTNGELVPFTKAYSGLTDTELLEVDSFIKKNTKEKFGPVRSVHPELVMEIAFEGIQKSSRHKSGIALRFPRILRWRKDKKASEANTLEDLNLILDSYEQGA